MTVTRIPYLLINSRLHTRRLQRLEAVCDSVMRHETHLCLLVGYDLDIGPGTLYPRPWPRASSLTLWCRPDDRRRRREAPGLPASRRSAVDTFWHFS